MDNWNSSTGQEINGALMTQNVKVHRIIHTFTSCDLIVTYMYTCNHYNVSEWNHLCLKGSMMTKSPLHGLTSMNAGQKKQSEAM